jgi:hypothetical protein
VSYRNEILCGFIKRCVMYYFYLFFVIKVGKISRSITNFVILQNNLFYSFVLGSVSVYHFDLMVHENIL